MVIYGRKLLKRLAERALRTSIAPLRLRAMRRRSLVLAYHNVVPDSWTGSGDRSLHLTRSDFTAQLDIIQSTHDVVPLVEILHPCDPPQLSPRVAITFDDAYRGAVTIAIPELAQRRLPATIFVAPGFVGDGAFWWDELATTDSGLDPDVRATALDVLHGDDGSIREWAARREIRLRKAPLDARVASVGQLEDAIKSGHVTLGSHSWGHPSLTHVENDRLETELTRPLAWMGERFGEASIPILAYPYGHYDPRVSAAAARVGYRAALAIDGGWIPPDLGDPFAVPRINVPSGITPDGFALRVTGVLT